ncbi:MAG: sugar ABC transporter permease, partial [Candidatus Sumerlaeota bacterium]|nr:sugar ABC transporter permease [Candidatus Sumerlaeota bacterium]
LRRVEPGLAKSAGGPVRWLEDPRLAIGALVAANVWVVVGLQTVIFLAALQSAPADLYEAARIDGATAAQRFLHVTLPLLKPATFFVILISLFDSLQVFVLPQVMTRGGLDLSSDTVVLFLYRNGFEYFRLGYASAAAYVLFILTILATLAVRAVMGRGEEGLLPD